MQVIGLTGGIATGKSSVRGIFSEKNIPVIDADEVVHDLYENDALTINTVQTVFPEVVEGGKINRAELSRLISQNEENLALLVDAVMPIIKQRINKIIFDYKKEKYNCVVLEAPLLFEQGVDAICNTTICLTASRETQKARALSRAGMSEEKFEALIKNQWSNEQKIAKADVVINTEEPIEQTLSKIEFLIKGIEEGSKKNSELEKSGLYAGSFDPFTRGHLGILCEALLMVDKLYIGIGVNPEKKPLFDLEERKQLITSSIEDFITAYDYRHINGIELSKVEEQAIKKLKDNPNIIEVINFEGLTAHEALKLKATALIRGERLTGDHDAEMTLAMMNRKILEVVGSPLSMSTIPLSNIGLHYVSSSSAKEFCAIGKYIEAAEYVMPSVHNAMMAKALKKDFCEVSAEFGIERATADDCFSELIEAYSNDRHYHNLSHVARSLEHVTTYNDIYERLEHLNHLKMAIFFHDFVNGKGDEDEERSSLKMLSFLKKGNASEKDKQICNSLIKVTKHSIARNEAQDLESKIMADVDLAVLGSNRSGYNKYMQAIRQEYSDFPDATYARGRLEVLNHLFNKKELFKTPFFTEMFEEKARVNLQYETGVWMAWQHYNEHSRSHFPEAEHSH